VGGTVQDRFAIERQLYELCYLIDEPDPDRWAAIFTDDGVAEALMVGDSEPFSLTQGTDALRAFVQIVTEGSSGRTLHYLTGIVFDELGADRAKTRSTGLVTVQVAETSEPHVLTHGVYHDRWRKTADAWRLEHRRYTAYGYRSQPPAAVLAGK